MGELDEAIAEYRHALRIDPEFARAEYMLGVALAGRGWLDEAHDRDHRAVRDDPVRARAQKKTRDIAVAQGITDYKRALRIDPGLNLCGNNVGLTPDDADRLKEAISHYETAIRFDPWILIAHAARGQALLALGRFREAEAVTRRCLNRMHDSHEWRSNVVALLRRCERLTALENRLPAVLTGKDKLAGASEMIEFAELCGILGQPAAAARLYAKAFDASPPPAPDVRSDQRYRAACAAAQAGRGRGDGVGLGQAERARWRQRAREWLGAEVALWTGVLDNGAPVDRALVAQKLARLWADPDLAGLLDQEALDRLPPAERQEGRALGDAIDVLIRRAQTIN